MVQRVFRSGQLALKRRDAGRAAPEPQPHPPERELVQVPGGGCGRQQGAAPIIELVHQHRRGLHDPGDHERRVPGRRHGARPRVHPGELVRHPAAHPGAEEPGQLRGERNLAGGVKTGQPARHDRRTVLPEIFAVQAAVQGIYPEGVIRLALDHRLGDQAEPGPAGHHPGQVLDLPDGGQCRARDVDGYVAGIDRCQITPVGRVGAPGAGQRSQRHRAQQPEHQRQDHNPAPLTAPGRPPVVEGEIHAVPLSGAAEAGSCHGIILTYHAAPRAPGGTTIRGEGSTTRQVANDEELTCITGITVPVFSAGVSACAYREKCVTGRSSRCPPIVTSTFSL